jgi:hypothetical protein
MVSRFLFLFVVFLGVSCQTANDISPESVVKQWQNFMDKADYKSAKAISINDALELVSSLEQLSKEIPADASKEVSRFVSMSCKTVTPDTCICKSIQELTTHQDVQQIAGEFTLRKLADKWLVSSYSIGDDNIQSVETIDTSALNSHMHQDEEDFEFDSSEVQ